MKAYFTASNGIEDIRGMTTLMRNPERQRMKSNARSPKGLGPHSDKLILAMA